MTWHAILVLGAVAAIALVLTKATGEPAIPLFSETASFRLNEKTIVSPAITDEAYKKNVDTALADLWSALNSGAGTDELFARVQKSILELKVPAADKEWHLKLVLALGALAKAAKGEGSFADAATSLQALFVSAY